MVRRAESTKQPLGRQRSKPLPHNDSEVHNTLMEMPLLGHEHHPETLERLCLQALADGDFPAAYRFADRRCRINPPAQAHHYTLRADASYKMGEPHAALSDIAHALELAPDDIPANRRMLIWATGDLQIQSAGKLLTTERNFGILANAIDILRASGKRSLAAITYTDEAITGWVIWEGKRVPRLKITTEDHDTVVSIDPDPQHPLSTPLRHAADFITQRPRSSTPQIASVISGTKIIYSLRLRPNEKNERSLETSPSDIAANSPPATTDPSSVTLIVPVYRDYDATKDCLDSLVAELASCPQAKALVVDDDSPDPEIKKLLRELSKDRLITLVSNEQNSGFVESVNGALRRIPTGDVILINSDTVLPPGFIRRLMSAAYSASDIGTVTPLSNNGEFTSLPIPFRSNPLSSIADVFALDAAAAAANAGKVVDLPNGIGFCLYITRACLNAVGQLSDSFHRGYMEDVDFCLRAQEGGFRSVCATSVYVGHVGSRSFGAEKRSLVVQNLVTLESRFPKYTAECTAFLVADPLRPHRAAIERLIPKFAAAQVILVTGSGTMRSVAEERGRILRAEGASSMILETDFPPGGPRVAVFSPAESFPQSLSFSLDLPDENSAFRDYLADLKPARIEIIDPTSAPKALRDLLLDLNVPINLYIANAGLMCPHGTFLQDDQHICDVRDSFQSCRTCSPILLAGDDAHSIKQWRQDWEDVIRHADQIMAPCGRAKNFAEAFLVDQPVIELNRPEASASLFFQSEADRPRDQFGFLAIGENAADFRLMHNVVRILRHQHPEISIVVIGSTLDDVELMKAGNVFVTSDLKPAEYGRVLAQYDIRALFLATRGALFGHPVLNSGEDSDLPLAYFDWSLGQHHAQKKDLPLTPGITDRQVASSLGSWFIRG